MLKLIVFAVYVAVAVLAAALTLAWLVSGKVDGFGFLALLVAGLVALPWSLALLIFPPIGNDFLGFAVCWIFIFVNIALLAYWCWGKGRRKSPDVIDGLRQWRQTRRTTE